MFKTFKGKPLSKSDLIVILIIFIVFSLLCFWAFFIYFQEYIFFSRPPQRLSINQAVEEFNKKDKDIYVELTDTHGDCNHFQTIKFSHSLSSRYDTIVHYNSENTVAIVANYDLEDYLNCENIIQKPTRGKLSVNPSFINSAIDRGLIISPQIASGNRYELCTYCSQENSIGMMAMSGLIGLGALYLAGVAGYRLHKRSNN